MPSPTLPARPPSPGTPTPRAAPAVAVEPTGVPGLLDALLGLKSFSLLVGVAALFAALSIGMVVAQGVAATTLLRAPT